MPFVNNLSQVNFINKSVTPTGTPDIDAAWLNYIQSIINAQGDGLATYSSDLETLEATVGTLGAPYTDPGYISGLKAEWLSTTQISISSGACYVPATNNIASKSTITSPFAPPGLVANTWYYLYAIDTAGSLTFEASTTAPVAYFGEAKQKSGDSSRRFIDCFRTASASANIMRWYPGQTVEEKKWLESLNVAPLPVITAGTATTETTLTVSAMPAHTRLAILSMVNAGSQAVDIGSPDDAFALSSTNSLAYVGIDDSWITTFPLSSANQFTYRARAAGASFYVYLNGFRQTR